MPFWGGMTFIVDCFSVVSYFDSSGGFIKDFWWTRTKIQCEDGYHYEKNYQSRQGGRIIHLGCKRNFIQ